MSYLDDKIDIELYAFGKSCLYKVRLTNKLTGEIIDDIKVIRNANGRVVTLFPDEHQRLDWEDIPYYHVAEKIREEYRQIKKNKTNSSLKIIDAKESLEKLVVYFSPKELDRGLYNVVIASLNYENIIKNITVKYIEGCTPTVHFPFKNDDFPWPNYSSSLVLIKIREEFVKYINSNEHEKGKNEANYYNTLEINYNNANCAANPNIEVLFYDELPESGKCKASISADSEETIDEISVYLFDNNNVDAYLNFNDDSWPWNTYSRKEVRKHIVETFKKYIADKDYSIYQSVSKLDDKKDEYGRIRNAENSPYKYYPNTVLRRKINEKSKSGSWGELIKKMSEQVNPLISESEFDILSWINNCRYLSKAMVIDLYKSGYISIGWRTVHVDKLSKAIETMDRFGLIDRNHFRSQTDDSDDFLGGAICEIYSLAGNGSRLLREIGRPATYNQFDIYQDGNVVKKRLAANQLLVYLLKNYKNRIQNNYMIDKTIYLLSSEQSGARIYAGVNLDDKYVIVEPTRRVDSIIKDNDNNDIIEKFNRLIKLFNNSNDVYTSDWTKVHFPFRPVICYICEDDAHIKEISDLIYPILEEYPEQKVWFTHDLNTFNETVDGSRFVELLSGNLEDVKI